MITKMHNACLGADPDKYYCLSCGFIVYLPGIGKGAFTSFNKQILECPNCASISKQPSAKLTEEQIKQFKESRKL